MLTPIRRAVFPWRALVRVLPLALAAAAGSEGCSRPDPTEPVPLVDQACCIEANPDLTAFKGCELRRRECPKSHKWWMRGQVVCGPVDDANCLGGRCCSYSAQYDPAVGTPLEDWQPPGWAQPIKPAPEAEPGTGAEPEPEPAPTPAPEPEPDAPPSVTVTVGADGKPAIDGETLPLPEFETRICEAQKALPRLTVRIRAPSDTPHDAIMRVLEVVSGCGIKSVSMDQTTD